MMVIEDGIPIPPSRGRGGRVFPWRAMQIGQSIFVADMPQASVSGIVHGWAKRQSPPRRFVTRKVTENGAHGVRVWRVE